MFDLTSFRACFPLVGLLMVICHAKDTSKMCPEKTSASKCSCYETGYSPYFLTVDCNTLVNVSDLVSSLEPFHGKKISMMTIGASSLAYLPKSVFSKMEISRLAFYDCNFTRFSGPPNYKGNYKKTIFDGLDYKLTSFTCSSCFIKEAIDFGEFRNLKNLKSITIDAFNRYQPRYWESTGNVTILNFEMMSSVTFQSIHLSGTALTQIGTRSLSVNRQLESLSLPNNLLTDILRFELPKPAYRLRLIVLRKNRLQHIPEDFFESMPVLKTVDMAGNMIKTLNQYLLVPMFPKLQMTAFAQNPVDCDQNILWITQAEVLGITFPQWNDFQYLECYNPPKLRNKTVMSITEAEIEMENDI